MLLNCRSGTLDYIIQLTITSKRRNYADKQMHVTTEYLLEQNKPNISNEEQLIGNLIYRD